jgi:hypothetical protein
VGEERRQRVPLIINDSQRDKCCVGGFKKEDGIAKKASWRRWHLSCALSGVIHILVPRCLISGSPMSQAGGDLAAVGGAAAGGAPAGRQSGGLSGQDEPPAAGGQG